jgi:creatinine amidohydrolase/Fe(II)-dependent formamide hydrolase-like protein
LRAVKPAAELLAADGIAFHYTDIIKITAPVEKAVGKQEGGTHADEFETSMILYMDPKSVEGRSKLAESRRHTRPVLVQAHSLRCQVYLRASGAAGPD